MTIRLNTGWSLALALCSAPLAATEVETAGPVTVTPPNAFTHYNTTGVTIVSAAGTHLYLYHQGGGDIQDATCPGGGDKIIAYRAPISNGVPGTFERIGRISPCVKSPACVDNPETKANECNPWPAASYGPGQVFQATVNGVTQWHLLADVSNTSSFHNVWHAASTDGINWTWDIAGALNSSQIESNIQERAGQPGGDVVAHTITSNWSPNPFLRADNFALLNPILRSFDGSNNSEWWGFLNVGGGVTALRIAWATGSPVASLLTSTSPSWTYTPVTGGNLTGLTPAILYPAANVKTLLLESGQYQLWGAIPEGSYGNNVNCNTATNITCTLPQGCLTGDGTTVANGASGNPFLLNTGPTGPSPSCSNCRSGFAWWPVTRTSFGATQSVRSQMPMHSLPSGYEVARLFPFRWNSTNGDRYLFSATNDNHICNEFLFSSFFRMYVVRTTLNNLSDVCTPSATKLCLQNGRFEVAVDFVNGGTTQAAQTKTFSDQSGFFTFFGAANPEVGVKILDGRPVNGKWWVFHGALTSLQYTVKITDTVGHKLMTYLHPASGGTSLCGGADTGAFSLVASAETGAENGAEAAMAITFDAEPYPGALVANAVCTPSATRLCLFGGRFQVEVKKGGVSQGAALISDSAGTFWFSSSENVEVPVKIIDGRTVNGKFWVFFGSLTDQAYQVVVTDTVSGAIKTYTPPAAHCGMSDTGAF